MIINILSVKQPWAWLICAGYKDVENRSWTTNYRGPLYIHAGKSFDWDALNYLEWENPAAAKAIIEHFKLDRSMVLTSCKLNPNAMDEFGAIVGCVDLVGVETNASSKWAEPGLYHWMVANPMQIEPIPLRGQLQIFKAEIDESLIRVKG